MDTRNQSSTVNYTLDGYIAGYDKSFFKTITGTDPVAAAGLIPFQSASCSSRASFKYGDFEMSLKVPVGPTAGDNRIFGLQSIGMGLSGAIFFAIQGAVFSARVYNNAGVALLNQTLTWDVAWTATETKFRIKWDRDVVEFWIADARVASYRVDPTIQHTLSTYGLPVLITNLNADSMGLRYLAIRDARFVQSPSSIGSGTDISVTVDSELPAGLTSGAVGPTSTMTGELNTLPFSVYNTVQPTRVNAQGGPFQSDSLGNTLEAMATQIAGEDLTNQVQGVLLKPTASATYSWTLFKNLGSAVTANIKATPGSVKSIYCHNLNASPRYIQIHKTATTPAGGAVPELTFLVPGAGVLAIDGSMLGEDGYYCTTGIAFAFSTAEATYVAGVGAENFTTVMFV